MSGRSNPPLIGVTTSEVRAAERTHHTQHGEPPRKEIALGIVYMRVVEQAGGVPVVVSPVRGGAIDSLLDRLDGVCLSGGPDLEPQIYDAAPHPCLGPTEPEFDRFEQELTKRADAREMPILGICRGMQSLNVARGGTLLQHLPDVTDLVHRQASPGHVATHPISIDPGSLLAQLTGETSLDVNSFHHQSPDRIGDGLVVVARAPDGIVEAIEDTRRPFCMGVQWHAELMTDREPEAALFARFVEVAAALTGVPA
jgi:putative glutamine amidotransferase